MFIIPMKGNKFHKNQVLKLVHGSHREEKYSIAEGKGQQKTSIIRLEKEKVL